jgi:phenylacetate-CoA ligase
MLDRQLKYRHSAVGLLNNQKQPGLKSAIKLCREMAERVPAYKDFLQRNGIDPSKIKTAEDFRQVPIMDKNNYLRKYPLKHLCWDGKLATTSMISVSSGSTGEPFFWPHGFNQHTEGVLLHRYIYEKIFDIQDKSTLVVICFSMGTWIAGPFTMLSTLGASAHHEVLNTITPGIDIEDAARAIKSLHKSFDKLIIAGYPPMVKDVIEQASELGVSWKSIDVSLLLAGETISEEWRDYVLKEIHNPDVYQGSINIYGTADATIIGHESPYSIRVRRLYNRKSDLMRKTFGTEIIPTLVQYHPELRFLEEVDGELVFTTRSGLPLCRYNIHDRGKVFQPAELTDPIVKELKSHSANKEVRELDFWRSLPFVSVNGRNDLTITFYGLLIFPENIKAALISKQLQNLVSGKFVMQTKYDKKMEQYFEVDIELSRGTKAEPDLTNLIRRQLVETITEVNAEYRKLRKSLDRQADPVVKLFEFGHDKFKLKTPKHHWTTEV